MQWTLIYDGAATLSLTSESAGLTFSIPDGVAPEALAPSVVAGLREADSAPVVTIPNRGVERTIAGAIAAAFNAPVLAGVTNVDGSTITVDRFGGISTETVEIEGAAILIRDPETVDSLGGSATETSPAELYGARITGETPSSGTEVNLPAATRIVVAGRGFKSREDLVLAEQLAAALDADYGCTRPLAEGMDWMEKARYVGVSGQHVTPELYVAVGTSGQIHHLTGVDAQTIVAICDDEAAPIFHAADYGIVGDLYEVVPALIEALNGSA